MSIPVIEELRPLALGVVLAIYPASNQVASTEIQRDTDSAGSPAGSPVTVAVVEPGAQTYTDIIGGAGPYHYRSRSVRAGATASAWTSFVMARPTLIPVKPLNSFSANQPVFTGVVQLNAGAGEKRVKLSDESNNGSVEFYGASEVLRGGIRGATGPTLIVDAVGTVRIKGTTGVQVGDIGTAIIGIISATTTWNPGSIAAFDRDTTTVNVPGALAGDAVFATNEFQNDDKALHLFARVTAADTVTLYLHNTWTGGAINPASRTVRVVVMQF